MDIHNLNKTDGTVSHILTQKMLFSNSYLQHKAYLQVAPLYNISKKINKISSALNKSMFLFTQHASICNN